MHLTIGKKLYLSFGCILAIIAISTGVTYYHLNDLSKSQGDLFGKRMPIREAFSAIRRSEHKLVADLQAYALNGYWSASNAELKERIRSDSDDARANVDKLSSLAVTFSKKATKQQAEDSENGLLAIVNASSSLESAIDAGGDDGQHRAQQILQQQVAPAAEIVEKDTGDAVATGGKMADATSALIVSDTGASMLALIAGGILSLILSSFLAFGLSRKVTSGIRTVLERASAIAGGDLSGEPLSSSSRDELGQLTEAINQMQQNLADLLQAVVDKAASVASTSEQISATAKRSADGASAQRDQTNQAATAMHEMSATVDEVSENSNSAANAARHAADLARTGGSIVEQTLETMKTISANTAGVAAQIQGLGKRSEQIGRIINVINEIAGQTNLLALNAAIEAARAGEHGRGFGVVAGEVRQLAERTTKATQEIGGMISGIQEDTLKAVYSIDSESKDVQMGVDAATQAGASLKEIIEAAEQVGSMIMQIATASIEQSSTAQEVNRTVQEIARITMESTEDTEKTAGACKDLSDLADQLRQLVMRFKVEHGTAVVGRSPLQTGRQDERGLARRHVTPLKSSFAKLN
jgi:methyl-accepting chemotaxis protein